MRMRMHFTLWTAALLLGTVTVPATAADKAKKETKTRDVTVDDLKLTVPETWKQVKPSSKFRKGQFEIPAAKDGEDKVAYVVYQFAGGGGGVGANVRRWIGQFESKGRKVNVAQGKAPQGPYILVDITGTYNKPIGPPIRMQTERLPNARMMAVILGVKEKKKVYYIKVAGGKKTVTANAEAIRASFGGKAETETKLKLQKPGKKQ